VITYNAALNKTAYQSGAYSNSRGVYLAHLANDGSHETNATRGNVPRCAVSQFTTSPWWAVDLGRPIIVYRVDFTNRADCCGIKNILVQTNYLFNGLGRGSLSPILEMLYSVDVCLW